jgi:toxin ParE1/3/4
MSAERWGPDGKHRYALLLNSAMLQVASDPEGATTRDRADLLRGLRSFHLRHARPDVPEAKIRRPVHVLYYRSVRQGLVEIIRVLHERMEPSRHIGAGTED